jgi:hypothetical protein
MVDGMIAEMSMSAFLSEVFRFHRPWPGGQRTASGSGFSGDMAAAVNEATVRFPADCGP